MTNYIQRAIKKATEGKYDVTEERVGNYEVFMKYDGYSVMLEIRHIVLGNICKFDSLKEYISITNDMCLTDKKKKNIIIQSIQAIKNLGYSISNIFVYKYETGKQAYDEDITNLFQKHIQI